MSIDYERLSEIIFIIWDNEQDYNDETTQLRIGKLFKDKERIYSNEDFERVLNKYKDVENQEFLFFIHLDHSSSNKGYHTFINSKILKDYNSLNYYLISRTPRSKIFEDNSTLNVFSWDHYQIEIDKLFKPQTVLEMKKLKENKKETNNVGQVINKFPNYKYAIFTALYEEFIEVEKLFDWDIDIKTGTSIYKTGTLKNSVKKVVACFATKSGMVEASIIATEMINMFKPEYIFMPGVCGGTNDTDYGSVIVALKVFLFQKGKLSDISETNNDGIKEKVKLLYNGVDFDINNITDSKNNKIDLIIENYENESESIDINTDLQLTIQPKLKQIEEKINIPYKTSKEKIKVHFEPMACSMMVINKEDYFDERIKPIDRKTKAVEMESYGVARAAAIANGGKTKFLIFKSVMDKTKLKDDGYKEKAAFTSAQFLKYLLEDDVL
jgi:nucleoside phosphorylase